MRLACYDPDTGEELADYSALKEAYERDRRKPSPPSSRLGRQPATHAEPAEGHARGRVERAPRPNRQRAEAESKARVQAEARIRELEAELKRSRRRGCWADPSRPEHRRTAHHHRVSWDARAADGIPG